MLAEYNGMHLWIDVFDVTTNEVRKPRFGLQAENFDARKSESSAQVNQYNPDS
jgi:hypothetical protein